jgi:hypothetical protein
MEDGRAHRRGPFDRRGLEATRAGQMSCDIRGMSHVLYDRTAVTWRLPQNIRWHRGNGNPPYSLRQIGGRALALVRRQERELQSQKLEMTHWDTW